MIIWNAYLLYTTSIEWVIYSTAQTCIPDTIDWIAQTTKLWSPANYIITLKCIINKHTYYINTIKKVYRLNAVMSDVDYA